MLPQNDCDAIKKKPPGTDGKTQGRLSNRPGEDAFRMNRQKNQAHYGDEGNMGVCFVLKNKLSQGADR